MADGQLSVELVANIDGFRNNLNQASKSASGTQRSIQSLQIQLQSFQRVAANATDPKVLTQYNKKIQETQSQITRLGNVGKEGFDQLGNAVEKSRGSLSEGYSIIKTIANILPGLGIAGVIGFAAGPIIEYVKNLEIVKGTARDIATAAAFDSDPYKQAVTDVAALGVAIGEFHDGIITGNKLVNDYNDSIGKTSGKIKTAQEAEDFYNSKAGDFVTATLLKAKAQSALQTAVEETLKAQKRASSDNTLLDYVGAAGSALTGLLTGRYIGNKSLVGDFKDALNVFKKKDVDELNAGAKTATKIFADLQREADKFNKSNGINLDGDGNAGKKIKTLSDIMKELSLDIAKVDLDFSKSFDEKQVAKISAIQKAINSLTELGYKAQSKAIQDLIDQQIKLNGNLNLGKTFNGSILGSANQGANQSYKYNSVGGIGSNGIVVKDDSLNAYKRGERALDSIRRLNADIQDEINNGLSGGLSGFGQSIGKALAEGGSVIDAVGTSLLSGLGAILTQLGEAALKIGAGLIAIKLALKSLNPFVAVAAGVGLIALGSFFSSRASSIGDNVKGGSPSQITAFANGGVVYGPTNALIGEYAGAKSDPEVVAPLSKLKSIIGKGTNDNPSNPYNPTFVVEQGISMNKLVVAIRKEESKRK